MTTSVRDRFTALGPWVTRYVVDGEPLGGEYDAQEDRRLEQFFERHAHTRRVLELGCLEGGHSIRLARQSEHVTALDARPENIERARFVADLLDVSNISFQVADLETFDLSTLGRFDVVFNVGLLYHLPQPWALLEQLAEVTDSMFLWTHVARPTWRNTRRGGYRGSLYREGGVPDPLSGMSPSSFWPTESELIRMLHDAGFTKAEIIEREPDHPHGPAVLLDARTETTEEPPR